jgi:hypothetical protein
LQLDQSHYFLLKGEGGRERAREGEEASEREREREREKERFRKVRTLVYLQ